MVKINLFFMSAEKNNYTDPKETENLSETAPGNGDELEESFGRHLPFENIIHVIPAGLVVTDAEKRNILFANHRKEQEMGIEPGGLIGQPITIFNKNASLKPITPEVFDTMKPMDLITENVTVNGVIRHIHRNVRPEIIGGRRVFVSIEEDITEKTEERKKREEYEIKLSESYRHVDMGKMAANIAHELRNIFALMNLSQELVRIYLDQIEDRLGGDIDPDIKENLNMIRQQLIVCEQKGEIGGNICSSLMNYSGREEVTKCPINLDYIIKEYQDILKTAIKNKGYTLNMELANNLPEITGNTQQIVQILINLIKNSAEAIDLTNNQGLITISTGTIKYEDIVCDYPNDNLSGECIYLSVRDNGIGMDVETKKQIFDLGFTNKQNGSGYGLSNVFGFVFKGHNGAIKVESQEKKGCNITLLFPINR